MKRNMETLQAIFTRRSVRRFSEKRVEDAVLHSILRAGMSGPSAVNARPWQFLVVRDKATLSAMADAGGGGPMEPLRGADFAVLVCGDLHRAFSKAPDFWIVDASIAAQNLILAAHDLGIGSVWLGTWPVAERVKAQQALFGLPEHIVPHSIVAFGYPEKPDDSERDLYDETLVHFEKW